MNDTAEQAAEKAKLSRLQQDSANLLDGLRKYVTLAANAELERDRLRRENDELKQWVNDLQSGMYINCVYCGHRYGPEDEVAATMQEALYEHIAQCPKHPLSQAKRENAELREQLAKCGLIGWFDPGSKRFCYTDEKETWPDRRRGYTWPVYASPKELQRMADQPAEAEQEGKGDGKANTEAK